MERERAGAKQINNVCRKRYGCSVEAAADIAQAFGVEACILMIPIGPSSESSVRQLQRLVVSYLGADGATRKQIFAAAKEAAIPRSRSEHA